MLALAYLKRNHHKISSVSNGQWSPPVRPLPERRSCGQTDNGKHVADEAIVCHAEIVFLVRPPLRKQSMHQAGCQNDLRSKSDVDLCDDRDWHAVQ